ncbi:RB1 [Acanthosepion pharaonis]|uniref:RB1 n=1 Tax=Acanthosepion pharaonis TaxID=158019 RepID=A0A812E3D5_ACAPH|nr:RB1 [Sepia pharaonis]
MCCLFGICRVVRQDIKFKDIMTVYKELLHSQPESSHVFKVILLQNGDTDSIVGFYNKVFLPIMKNYLLQFNPARPSAPPLSPIPKGVTSSPVCSVAGKKNLHVSSVKSPIFKSQSQLTPRTSQLYCFGEGIGSAEKLRSINDSVAQSCVPNCQKRLQFDSLDNCARRNAVKCLKFDGPDSSTSQSESTFKSPMSPAHSAARGSTTPGKETPQKKESPSAGPRHVTPNTKRTQRHLRFDDNQGSSENEASGSTAVSFCFLFSFAFFFLFSFAFFFLFSFAFFFLFSFAFFFLFSFAFFFLFSFAFFFLFSFAFFFFFSFPFPLFLSFFPLFPLLSFSSFPLLSFSSFPLLSFSFSFFLFLFSFAFFFLFPLLSFFSFPLLSFSFAFFFLFSFAFFFLFSFAFFFLFSFAFFFLFSFALFPLCSLSLFLFFFAHSLFFFIIFLVFKLFFP